MATELDVPAVFLGRVPDAVVAALYGCADVFAMLCRVRWGGLEQEGFGIVFVEAAAAGVAQLAGASGGAAEAVEAGVTGFVIDPPTDVQQVSTALVELLRDAPMRERDGRGRHARAVREFRYDVLTDRLGVGVGCRHMNLFVPADVKGRGILAFRVGGDRSVLGDGDPRRDLAHAALPRGGRHGRTGVASPWG